jgi:hypothetical protein
LPHSAGDDIDQDGNPRHAHPLLQAIRLEHVKVKSAIRLYHLSCKNASMAEAGRVGISLSIPLVPC